MSELNILQNVKPANIVMTPYPHVVVEGALPEKLFNELARTYPSMRYVARDEENLNNKATLRGNAEVLDHPDEVAPIWREFFEFHLSQDFFDAFVRVWGGVVEQLHPDLPLNFGKPLEAFHAEARATGKGQSARNQAADIVLDCVFGVNTPVSKPTAVRGPHIDSPHKLFSSLLYFRTEQDDSRGGDHVMFELKNRMYPRGTLKRIPERYVRDVKVIPYRSNLLLFWLNGAHAIHGVTPRHVTQHPRRYVAVAGECYGDTTTGEYFARDPQWNRGMDRLRSLLNV
ncbi:MAG: hypothetical protein R3E84_19255 [Pseudomonadales bacterium]